MATEFDIEERWPELFAQLMRRSVVRAWSRSPVPYLPGRGTGPGLGE